MDISFALLAGGFVTLGLTNNTGGGLLVGGEVHGGFLALGVEARAIFPSEFGPKLIGDDVLDYSRLQGSLVPCVKYWYVFGCGVLTVGAQVSQSSIHVPNTVVDPIWEVGPRLGAEIPLGDTLAVRAWGEVLFNPYPTNYQFDVNSALVSEKQISGAAGFVGAGLVVHLGK